jgi:hypothetical protein
MVRVHAPEPPPIFNGLELSTYPLPPEEMHIVLVFPQPHSNGLGERIMAQHRKATL